MKQCHHRAIYGNCVMWSSSCSGFALWSTYLWDTVTYLNTNIGCSFAWICVSMNISVSKLYGTKRQCITEKHILADKICPHAYRLCWQACSDLYVSGTFFELTKFTSGNLWIAIVTHRSWPQKNVIRCRSKLIIFLLLKTRSLQATFSAWTFKIWKIFPNLNGMKEHAQASLWTRLIAVISN